MTDERPIGDRSRRKRRTTKQLRPERGERIKLAREALGLSQEELAGRVGISLAGGRVSKWENGANIMPKNLVKLADVLKVPVAHIEQGADLPAPPLDPSDLHDLASQVKQLQEDVRKLKEFQAAIADLEGLPRRDEEPPPIPDPPDKPRP